MRYHLFVVLTALLIFIASSTTAQAQAAAQPDTDSRIQQLEAQVARMQAELDELKKLIVASAARKPDEKAVAVSEPPAVKTSADPAAAAVSESKPAEAEKKQVRGIDVGTARIIPYGTIYFNAFGNSAGVNNGDIPLFAAPSGGSNIGASARQTRLGLKLEGGKIGDARLSAVVEADFYGGFPSAGIGENFGIVRLRLANARLDWEKTSLTVGQDWMVFAPVSPVSPAAAAIPQMASAGNPWARLPQVKIEQRLGDNITVQGAVLAPQTSDFPATGVFFLQPTSGANSKVPFLQSRIAFGAKNWLGAGKAGSVGLSGHYGRSKVFTGSIANDIDSIGVALDWSFPLAKRLSLAGEAFFGRNLGGFQAGVYQNYNNDFAFITTSGVVPGGVRAIGTRGGWAQLGFTPDVLRDRLSFYGSLGVDDPRDEDLVSRTPRDWRTQNFSYAFDTVFKITPQFSIGAEFRRLQTIYLLSGRRSANHVNLGAAYSF